MVIGAISASVAGAGVVAAAAVQLLAPAEAPAPPAASTAPAAAHAPALNHEGRLVAVTADSVTARSADGVTQTYRITPDTTALTVEGNHTVSPAATFDVDDEVAIVAIVQNGTPVATTVADRQVAGLNGPPMDAVDVQPASHTSATAATS
ncbi:MULTISPECIES: hypothetical protein [unclassified Mycobacterium]|uniref:hypothetical protein n=1 Tax=unclassified Mycobacterium TaxID=2642494 RepID=UPI0034289BF8